MNTKEYQIFIAAYFSDKETLARLIESEDDLLVRIDLPNSKAHKIENCFTISVVDILQMNLDCWFDLKEKKQLKSYLWINPSEFYKSSQTCHNYLQNHYLKYKAEDVKYNVLYNTIFDFSDSDTWFSKKEKAEFINQGFREIDLDLIEAAIRGDENKCVELLQKGANPMIDPENDSEGSVVFSHLGTEADYHFLENLLYHEIYRGLTNINLNSTDAYNMISDLFRTASSDKLYRLINETWQH